MILRRRTQLMNWLEGNAPTASIRRAVGEGSVEFLGWFAPRILGSTHPGWITKVTSTITGIIWNVIVRRHPYRASYYTWVLNELDDVPWHVWNPTDSENPFFYGDQPETYRKNRESAQAQRRTALYQEDDAP